MPYQNTGQAANAALVGGVLGSGGGGGPLTVNPFATLGPAPTYAPAPFTMQTFQQSPGYQYQLQQAQGAIQNSAAGRTGTLSGNTLNALQANAVGLSNQDWYNAMNQYYNQYNTAFNANNQNYWNTYNADVNNQLTNFNMLNQLNTQGLQAATGQAGAQQANLNAQNANILYGGNVQAAGIVGGANALTGGVNSLTNTLLAPSSMYNNSLAANLAGFNSQNPYANASTIYNSPGQVPFVTAQNF